MGWKRVSRRNPCPVCGHGDWCGVSDDGAVVHCMRVESANPCLSGGWFHFERERQARRQFAYVKQAPVRPRLFDAARTMAGFRTEFECPGEGRDVFDSLLEIARDLNMCAADVDRLNVGRSAFHGAWAFPMLDGHGRCVGIRLREYGTGRKWSVAGSRDGLFYDPDLELPETSENGLEGREVVVVEGATDCIAGYAVGLPCVGRSSCNTGADALKSLCARLKATRMTVVSDNDGYKARPDGAAWRPGAEGAQALARRMGLAYRIVTPPTKDLRGWLAAGMTAETFRAVARLQPWRRADSFGTAAALACAREGRFPLPSPCTPTLPL